MPAAHASHPNVTPLIDIVMCLIIFYMLVAKIGVNTGADKNMSLPASLKGITLKDLGNNVVLNVYPGAGEQPLVTLFNPKTSRTEEIKLIEGTKRPLLDFLKALRGSNERLSVIIRADEGTEYRYIEPVLVTCAEARVAEFNYATREVVSLAQ
jgi:biopolymer transport protein ExbD